MYNIHQLTGYAKKFLKENYNLELEVPIKFNTRMKTTCGWFKYRANNHTGERKSISIELNKFFVDNNEAIVVLDVLRHELVHYALFELKKPHKDGHPTFENELKRLKIVSQSNIDKYEIKSKPVRVSAYKCKSCSKTYYKKRALHNDGKYHRCNCKGELISLGKVMMES